MCFVCGISYIIQTLAFMVWAFSIIQCQINISQLNVLLDMDGIYNPSTIKVQCIYCIYTTFLNVAKHGEITTKFQFTEPQQNRNGTGFFVNLIMASTVHLIC